jgi:uncharacterized protein YbdZ (MbtH family)
VCVCVCVCVCLNLNHFAIIEFLNGVPRDLNVWLRNYNGWSLECNGGSLEYIEAIVSASEHHTDMRPVTLGPVWFEGWPLAIHFPEKWPVTELSEKKADTIIAFLW